MSWNSQNCFKLLYFSQKFVSKIIIFSKNPYFPLFLQETLPESSKTFVFLSKTHQCFFLWRVPFATNTSNDTVDGRFFYCNTHIQKDTKIGPRQADFAISVTKVLVKALKNIKNMWPTSIEHSIVGRVCVCINVTTCNLVRRSAFPIAFVFPGKFWGIKKIAKNWGNKMKIGNFFLIRKNMRNMNKNF